MKATTLAKLERKVRPFVGLLPPDFVIKRYSKGRLDFLKRFQEDIPVEGYFPVAQGKVLWGINFQTPLFNAAGMFKNGESYDVVAAQGAGAYLGGTGTWNDRVGNEKNGIKLPFAPYPLSGAASNWLGLPNKGDMMNASNARQLRGRKQPGCPIGWSVMGSPDYQGTEKVSNLVNGMWYYANAGVDFLEQNGSCPNVPHGNAGSLTLRDELNFVGHHFINRRIEQGNRLLPVIFKASNDFKAEDIPKLMDMLFESGYAGVNFGNTSVDYARHRNAIHPMERKLYDHFTKTYTGGVSGRPLKEISLDLASRAVEYLHKGGPRQEFHVVRTGGIDCKEDLRYSEDAGIALNQWFTGYFENFARRGHKVYRNIFEAE